MAVFLTDYNGWLGDFGPLHTKTVRSEWSEADDKPEPHTHRTKFEWNFEHLPRGSYETAAPLQAHGGVRRTIDDFDDDLSDGLSVNSDPVFRWLKTAI